MAETISVIKSAQMFDAYLPEPEVIRNFLASNWLALSSGDISMDLLELEKLRQDSNPVVFKKDYESRAKLLETAGPNGNAVTISPSITVTRTAHFENVGGKSEIVPDASGSHDINYVKCLTQGFTAYFKGKPWTAARKIAGMDIVVSAFLSAIPTIREKMADYVREMLHE